MHVYFFYVSSSLNAARCACSHICACIDLKTALISPLVPSSRKMAGMSILFSCGWPSHHASFSEVLRPV